MGKREKDALSLRPIIQIGKER